MISHLSLLKNREEKRQMLFINRAHTQCSKGIDCDYLFHTDLYEQVSETLRHSRSYFLIQSRLVNILFVIFIY